VGIGSADILLVQVKTRGWPGTEEMERSSQIAQVLEAGGIKGWEGKFVVLDY